jgi:hypothetical protein
VLSSPAEADFAATAVSPEGELQVLFRSDSAGTLEYRLQRGQTAALEWSPLGIEISGVAFGKMPLEIEWQEPQPIMVRARPLHGKFSETVRKAVEGRISLRASDGKSVTVEWRLFNDTFAFRYRLGAGVSGLVTAEQTGFRVPAGGRAWLGEAERPALYQPNGQPHYREYMIGASAPAADSFYLPALFSLDDGHTWMLLHEANLDRNYVGSRLASTVVDRIYRLKFPNPLEGDVRLPHRPSMPAGSVTPWRLVVVGSLADVVETPMVELLSDPPAAELFSETDWIRPGRVAWSWWSQGTGTPSLQRNYIDFASAQDWDYVLIDANWSLWADAEAAVQELVEYAAARNVGIFLWYNSGGANNSISEQPRDRLNTRAAIEAEFARLAEWGVCGVKVDFFRSDKQARIIQYLDILEIAANHRLQVNFHGATVPRGWSYTYPNLMTVEAVHGAEMYKWPPGPSAAHNVLLAFTRGIVGPMDYTPMTFEAALAGEGISFAHQVALGVVFQSSLQHWADQADGAINRGYGKLFAAQPLLADFLREVPVTWDATVLLDGHPESHVVMARRKGSAWWIGAITTSGNSLQVDVDPSRIFPRAGQLTVFRQGATPALVQTETLDWTPSETIALQAAGADGVVVRYEADPDAGYWSHLPDSNGWRNVDGFGWLDDINFPYIYTATSGWTYVYPHSHSAEWFWSPDDGWYWTLPAIAPWAWFPEAGWRLADSLR